ncbi:hypothetical protein SERLA73DRAFT_117737 [Serpula lacrymans var. lacrymans S7.3]|uniref:BTB domain-containing protein n=2 Tax=Serpula lacrymans var. lacrymans TaxID=341189 RepID=F8QHS6_SERL3|nr:uncharacterized protein SERLADRAFT_362103 [Serpula lacrymans var. lacrymans S7.9]EGN92122.1 hypothetical protein SERLA73DRAFT_117737 [Serpula lacrymans var. lacrymans S7.3]EGO23977.1 hypothetical protein SERLADRAFT_362103 [Serpula lacrymans var. lacrymans S7.9]
MTLYPLNLIRGHNNCWVPASVLIFAAFRPDFFLPLKSDEMTLGCAPFSGGLADDELSNSALLYPTPTPSPTDLAADSDAVASVSTTFFLGSSIDPLESDLIVSSSDAVLFYLHTHVILSASDNAFDFLLSAPPKSPSSDMLQNIIHVPEPSAVLNVVLHAIYNISCAHHAPSFHTLEAAVPSLRKYGMSLERYMSPSTPLYSLLLSHAPLYPLELYTLAASYDQHDLAASTSAHLLSTPLDSLTDDVARRIGARYLKRLFFLHIHRVSSLKHLLLPPPRPHPPTSTCDLEDQKPISRAWTLAAAYLVWDARPGMHIFIFIFILSFRV